MSAAMILAPGQEVGDFTVQSLIGSGGMGSVYRALDNRHDRTVALKILDTDVQAEDPGAVARFSREAKAIGDVAHPAIARVHHSGIDAGIAWISMQFVVGSNLSEVLAKRGRLSFAAVCRILAPIAEALDELHAVDQRGTKRVATIHRDIKPANIIVSSANSKGPAATLVDFGIARRSDGEDRLTETSSVTGTQGFLAPEAVTRNGDARGPAADQYSLAVVAYRALTGALPFPDAVLTPSVHYRYWEQLTPASTFDERLPPRIDRVLARALTTNPDRRFDSCMAFVKALKAPGAQDAASAPAAGPAGTRRYSSSGGPPPPASPPPLRAYGRPPAGPGRPGRRSRPGRTIAWLVGALALVGIVAVGGYFGYDQYREATKVELPRELRNAFPGLVPATDRERGPRGTTCSEGENTPETRFAVVCTSRELSYQVYDFISPRDRDAITGAMDGSSVSFSGDAGCSVTVIDVESGDGRDGRTIAVVPDDDRIRAMALMTVPRQTWNAATTYTSELPLCG
ncbi:MAG: serine/threonine-protein kinase [Actinomycetia bacterium]|nr:serine/threonine-protein kinase [Actinomycetes bacterium]